MAAVHCESAPSSTLLAVYMFLEGLINLENLAAKSGFDLTKASSLHMHVGFFTCHGEQ